MKNRHVQKPETAKRNERNETNETSETYVKMIVNQSSDVLFITGNTLSFFVSSQRYWMTYLFTQYFGALTYSERGQVNY